jgi:hypothetical protein
MENLRGTCWEWNTENRMGMGNGGCPAQTVLAVIGKELQELQEFRSCRMGNLRATRGEWNTENRMGIGIPSQRLLRNVCQSVP